MFTSTEPRLDFPAAEQIDLAAKVCIRKSREQIRVHAALLFNRREYLIEIHGIGFGDRRGPGRAVKCAGLDRPNQLGPMTTRYCSSSIVLRCFGVGR